MMLISVARVRHHSSSRVHKNEEGKAFMQVLHIVDPTQSSAVSTFTWK
jgi:hypothetical protein